MVVVSVFLHVFALHSFENLRFCLDIAWLAGCYKCSNADETVHGGIFFAVCDGSRGIPIEEGLATCNRCAGAFRSSDRRQRDNAHPNNWGCEGLRRHCGTCLRVRPTEAEVTHSLHSAPCGWKVFQGHLVEPASRGCFGEWFSSFYEVLGEPFPPRQICCVRKGRHLACSGYKAGVVALDNEFQHTFQDWTDGGRERGNAVDRRTWASSLWPQLWLLSSKAHPLQTKSDPKHFLSSGSLSALCPIDFAFASLVKDLKWYLTESIAPLLGLPKGMDAIWCKMAPQTL